MSRIHSTAIIGPDVELAESVEIGPYCSVKGRVHVGPGTVLEGHNYLEGPLIMGSDNRVFPFATLGQEPQDLSFQPGHEGAGLVIGDRNTFREQFTAHRATSDEVPTRIGNDNYFMAGSHIAHDCLIGNRCILAPNVLIGGRVEIQDQVNFGGSSGVAQRFRVGRLAFISGLAAVTSTVPPFMMVRQRSSVGGVNVVGLRRSGMDRREVDMAKWLFRVLYLEGNTKPAAIAKMRDRADSSAVVREMIDFLTEREDALCHLEAGKYKRDREPLPEIEVPARLRPMVIPTRT